MKPFGPYDLSASSTQDEDLDLAPVVDMLVVKNASPYILTVQPYQGSQVKIPPYWADLVAVSDFQGRLTFSTDAGLAASNAPISVALVDAYQRGERVLGTYPVPLSYLFNLGNSVPINASGTSVANDGNPSGTPVVEATPSGGPQALLIDNNGNISAHMLVLEQFPASGDTVMLHIDPNAPPGWEWHLDAAGNLYLKEVVSGKTLVYYNGATQGQQLDNGILITDGAGHISSTAAAAAGADDLLSFAPSDDASLNAAWRASGNEMMLWDKSLGARIVSFFMGIAGIKISGTGSRMIAWSFFSGTGSGTFSHGLGLVPTVVLALQSVAGSQTMGWDTANGTTVHITAGNGAAWVALALNMV